MALSLSSSPLLLTPDLNRSDSLSRLSYPTPRLRVSDKQCSIKTIRLSRTHINPTAHNDRQPLHLHYKLPLQLASSSVLLFLGFGARICSAGPTQLPLTPAVNQQDQLLDQDTEQKEDEKLNQEFENWKWKTYALTVPLRVVSLQNSVPQSWVKDFMRSQGKRLKFQMNLCASIDGIVNNLSTPFNKVKAKSASYMAADLVSVGDSWLSFAIKKRLIELIAEAEDQDWFKCLSHKWKVYLRSNDAGEIDPRGQIWAAPYRWGTMAIGYKKSKFQNHNLAPIEDWKDPWWPELAGRISMVNSPREVIGSVRLFDSTHYLKAFGIGDVWVAVGWSSDVLPAVKRMSNVAVVVPKSGASLWADLWAIPAASRLETKQIGGQVRGPSPLIHQWIEFCLQTARALPFKQEVIPGASPSALESTLVKLPEELLKGKPSVDTNLIAGFLEPLSEATLSDYEWLVANLQNLLLS
ncbi:spermidine/putrescine-binding periplasmic protein [Citrus sinensis]|uniref:Spermidine/putrescine-binding periplasmic protein n=1 Tax=Citrus sinensis TaxID=2711 RepID=A0ACB8KGZ3_CITSI|nr:spermidine/putrescine-binding periplasmic protein [Citrus sinensis]